MNTNKWQRTYTNRNVCKKCNGEGVERILIREHPHGRGDEYELRTCSLCEGNGVVDVSKMVTTTITPVYKNKTE